MPYMYQTRGNCCIKRVFLQISKVILFADEVFDGNIVAYYRGSRLKTSRVSVVDQVKTYPLSPNIS